MVDHAFIRKCFLSLHPAVFAVTIREYPGKVFDVFHGRSFWERLGMMLFKVPGRVVIEQPSAHCTVFIFGNDIGQVANAIHRQEAMLRPTGLNWNFEIYEMSQREFREFGPRH